MRPRGNCGLGGIIIAWVFFILFKSRWRLFRPLPLLSLSRPIRAAASLTVARAGLGDKIGVSLLPRLFPLLPIDEFWGRPNGYIPGVWDARSGLGLGVMGREDRLGVRLRVEASVYMLPLFKTEPS